MVIAFTVTDGDECKDGDHATCAKAMMSANPIN